MKKIAVTLETVGPRIYVGGNTFPIRSELKSIGCHWDDERRQWWIGLAKKGELEKLVQKFNGKEVEENVDNYPVHGKMRYKGKIWYVIGVCAHPEHHPAYTPSASYKVFKISDNEAMKEYLKEYRFHLTSLDGTVHFWADGENCELIKSYPPPDRGKKQRTLAQIRNFIEKIKNESPEEQEERRLRQWAYRTHGGICRCPRSLDEGDGSCMYCGYAIL